VKKRFDMVDNTLQYAIEENNLLSSIVMESFYEFLLEYWDTAVSEPIILNWHIPFLCDQLQVLAERVFLGLPKQYDLIINIPPGSTKSTICSVMLPPWIWGRMNTARVIGASYAHNLAMDLSRKNRDVVTSDKYLACFHPDDRLKGRSNIVAPYDIDQLADRVDTYWENIVLNGDSGDGSYQSYFATERHSDGPKG